MEQVDTNRKNLFSRKIRAGKRTYFFDVKATKSSKDYYIVVTESRRLENEKFEKHKLFLYKEDFQKFIEALTETVYHIEQNLLVRVEKTVEV